MRPNQYQPNVVSPPGETLGETLDVMGLSQSQLAQHMGRPIKTINEIVLGKVAITPETALQLERALGIPAEFWNAREAAYRDSIARQQEAERLEADGAWLEDLPVKEMVKRGWIERTADRVEEQRVVLSFFGLASPARFSAVWSASSQFRKSQAFSSKPGALEAWLRKGEIEARRIPVEPYDEKAFENQLLEIRSRTRLTPEQGLREAQAMCARTGVALVVIPELKGTRASGATRWLAPDRAMIQLSLRYRSDDQIWFSFFHEAAHILRHGKRALIIERIGNNDVREQEANSFAQDFLIPPTALSRFLAAGDLTRHAIASFANGQGIASGIVVGRLQHDGHLGHGVHNDLKQPVSPNLMV